MLSVFVLQAVRRWAYLARVISVAQHLYLWLSEIFWYEHIPKYQGGDTSVTRVAFSQWSDEEWCPHMTHIAVWD